MSKLDTQLYPVIATTASNPTEIVVYLEQKLRSILPEVKRAQGEIEQRIKTSETIISKSPTVDEQSLNVKNKLIELHQKLIDISTEYQVLLQMLIGHFNSVSELAKSVDGASVPTGLPNDISGVELRIREHDSSKQATLERFKFIQRESEKLISRIYVQVSGHQETSCLHSIVV